MTEQTPGETFYLIVTDHDRGVFAVEWPMTDDKHWRDAAREARITNAALPAARPARIGMRLRPRIAARTSWLAFRPAVL
jgi:hypothetical protein